jgi:hypothetical protein
LVLEISRIKINNTDKIKYFNQISITLLNKIPGKPTEEVQIEFYTVALLPPIAMFVKREKKKTLVENPIEAIKVEKDLVGISNHSGNEESRSSTFEKKGKKNKGTSKIESDKKEKYPIDMEGMKHMIK